MNFIYILNFLIPILFVAVFGFWLDGSTQPDQDKVRKKLQRIK
ncbi:hypothetical protein [Bacillus benzoevorans]|uniref:Uncharacterized protein n=1 Tax=Bacillus benzoevorans TaxID=1456 RepID=A0A7X0HTP9_9BACI|nr:hypothetical protein [Bacillus benzoevorans]MBB6446663.1 hypothetical protein [Bacillus benzoevorans]